MKIKKFVLLLLCTASLNFLLAQPPPIEVSPGENTISDALMFAFPGDVLELAEGEYTETQTLIVSINLTIRGAEGATVIWNVPNTVGQAIHVKGNFHLENIIMKTDPDTLPNFTNMTTVECIWNMYGSVNDGEENNVYGNSIYIDHCQFIGFYKAIWIPKAIAGPELWIYPGTPDNKSHPVDSLIVTNSLFYGGGQYKMQRGIDVWHRQARVVKVQNCTFWNGTVEACQLNGYGFDPWAEEGQYRADPNGLPDYFHVLVDHCTFYEMGLPPIATRNGLGVFVYYTSEDDTIRDCVFDDISDFGIKAKEGRCLSMYIDYHVADPDIGWKAGCGVCQPYHYDLDPMLGAHCVTSEPRFINPGTGDFRYQEGAIALTAASDGGPTGNPTQVWNPGTWDHTPSTGIEENAALNPNKFALAQNYPNPFNPWTQISYSIPKSGFVRLEIYSASGKKVRSLVSKAKGAGSHSVVWDARNDRGVTVPSGVYFSRLCSGSAVETKKIVFLK